MTIPLGIFRANAEIILPVFFIGFFLAALVAIFARDKWVRKGFLVGFFTLFLLVNVVVGLQIIPLVHWHKFSKPRPESQTHYEFRVVDASGNELYYDHRATLSVDGATMRSLNKKMHTDYSAAKKQLIACYLLNQASLYREKINSRSMLHLARFPPHGIGDTWTETRLEEYERFVDIRFYRMNITTAPDGSKITDYSETVLFEYSTEANTNACPPMNSQQMVSRAKVAVL